MCNGFQARCVQHDAVKARRANVLFFGFGQIVPIGLNNVTGCGTQFIGGVLQAGVFFFRVSQCKGLRRAART